MVLLTCSRRCEADRGANSRNISLTTDDINTETNPANNNILIEIRLPRQSMTRSWKPKVQEENYETKVVDLVASV